MATPMVKHVAVREVNVFQTSFYVLKFFLELIMKIFFVLAHFLVLQVVEYLNILGVKSKSMASDK